MYLPPCWDGEMLYVNYIFDVYIPSELCWVSTDHFSEPYAGESYCLIPL
jgi:hypothetical protein